MDPEFILYYDEPDNDSYICSGRSKAELGVNLGMSPSYICSLYYYVKKGRANVPLYKGKRVTLYKATYFGVDIKMEKIF